MVSSRFCTVTYFVSVSQVFLHAGLTGAELRKAIFHGVEKESVSVFKGATEFSNKTKNF